MITNVLPRFLRNTVYMWSMTDTRNAQTTAKIYRSTKILTFSSLLILTVFLLFCFWATVCKTVRSMLSDRCPVCLSCPSVTLVHCGQTVGWIKMKLGTKIGLSPGHTVLDGKPAPLLQRCTAPNFRPISVTAKWLDRLRWNLIWR